MKGGQYIFQKWFEVIFIMKFIPNYYNYWNGYFNYGSILIVMAKDTYNEIHPHGQPLLK